MSQNSQQEKSLQNNIPSSFLQGNPLKFTLYNFYERSDRNVLYINDDPGNLRFNLEIENLLEETIFLDPKKLVKKDQGSEDNSPNENNFHIKLSFKEGELSPKSLETIDLSEYSKEDWSISRPQHNRRDHTVSIFLLKRSGELSIEGKKSAIITLVGIGANPIAGARATQLNVNYQGFDLKNNEQNRGLKSDKPYEKLVVLTIINYSGKQSAPLAVKFAHSPKVLNDGTEQDITIQIVNTGEEAIGFNENSGFLITIDVQGDGKEEPWALAEKDKATSIHSKDIKVLRRGQESNPSDCSDSWIIEGPNTQGEDPVWTIKPKLNEEGNTSIQPNEDIIIKLTNFSTSLRAGIGHLFVGYHDLPGYKDKTRILNVNKTCITEKDKRIGINKFPDANIQLDVAGKIVANALEIKQIENEELEQLELSGAKAIPPSLTVAGTVTANQFVANTLEVKEQQVNASLKVAETVTANQFVGKGAFVKGMIIMWSGDTDYLPDGWVLCDGYHGTPNLCDRFIVGRGSLYNTKTGGHDKVTLREENIPLLKHTILVKEHQHYTSFLRHWRSFDGHGNTNSTDKVLKADESGTNKWHGQWSDTQKVEIKVDNHGYKQPEAIKISPPYFALAFIMYLGM